MKQLIKQSPTHPSRQPHLQKHAWIADHEAPHYAVFSIPLLVPPLQHNTWIPDQEAAYYGDFSISLLAPSLKPQCLEYRS